MSKVLEGKVAVVVGGSSGMLLSVIRGYWHGRLWGVGRGLTRSPRAFFSWSHLPPRSSLATCWRRMAATWPTVCEIRARHLPGLSLVVG